MISHETTMKIISGICLFTWWFLMGIISMSGHDFLWEHHGYIMMVSGYQLDRTYQLHSIWLRLKMASTHPKYSKKVKLFLEKPIAHV